MYIFLLQLSGELTFVDASLRAIEWGWNADWKHALSRAMMMIEARSPDIWSAFLFPMYLRNEGSNQEWSVSHPTSPGSDPELHWAPSDQGDLVARVSLCARDRGPSLAVFTKPRVSATTPSPQLGSPSAPKPYIPSLQCLLGCWTPIGSVCLGRCWRARSRAPWIPSVYTLWLDVSRTRYSVSLDYQANVSPVGEGVVVSRNRVEPGHSLPPILHSWSSKDHRVWDSWEWCSGLAFLFVLFHSIYLPIYVSIYRSCRSIIPLHCICIHNNSINECSLHWLIWPIIDLSALNSLFRK